MTVTKIVFRTSARGSLRDVHAEKVNLTPGVQSPWRVYSVRPHGRFVVMTRASDRDLANLTRALSLGW